MSTTMRGGLLLAGGLAVSALLAQAAPAAAVPAADVTLQFGATGATSPPPIEDLIYHRGAALTPTQDATAPLSVAPGSKARFHVDGFHQPVVYQLGPHESLAQAYAALDRRAQETLAPNASNPAFGGTCDPTTQICTGRMTHGPVVAPHRAPTELLAQVDRPFGYTYLGHKSPDTLGAFVSADVDPMETTFGKPGEYVLLCNIAGHYQNFEMHGVLHVEQPSR